MGDETTTQAFEEKQQNKRSNMLFGHLDLLYPRKLPNPAKCSKLPLRVKPMNTIEMYP